MPGNGSWVVVGLDNGGTTNNATVLDDEGRFLVDELVECPSCVREGPDKAIEALAGALGQVLERTGIERSRVRAVGLDTPGPVSADGVISSAGATNFAEPAWRGYDIRSALQERLGLPVIYNNDANAAALYAHYAYFGHDEGAARSSIAAIVGTGLGGGVVEGGQVVCGAAGMAGELGHVWIPMEGLLGPGQPPPQCNCGLAGDAESVASLTGIEKNLLPYWLTRYPGHDLERVSRHDGARKVRSYGETGDPLALSVFGQQAMALGRLLTIAGNFTDPDVYFIGGGVVETAAHFRDWFLDRVREHTALRAEQARVATVTLVPDLDMAGARGSALAARAAVQGTDLKVGTSRTLTDTPAPVTAVAPATTDPAATTDPPATADSPVMAVPAAAGYHHGLNRRCRWTRTGHGHCCKTSAPRCAASLTARSRRGSGTGRPRTRPATAPTRPRR